jgi:hypothetical protein
MLPTLAKLGALTRGVVRHLQSPAVPATTPAAVRDSNPGKTIMQFWLVCAAVGAVNGTITGIQEADRTKPLAFIQTTAAATATGFGHGLAVGILVPVLGMCAPLYWAGMQVDRALHSRKHGNHE